jgi:type VI secretion system protein ImpF
MARTELERSVQPSLLDRLTDLAPDVPADPPVRAPVSARAFRDAVQRDVEWLLNTRRTIVAVPPTCPEVRRSVHEFGLPDTTGLPVSTREGRERLLEMLQDTLDRFEPRLGAPRVRIVEVDGGGGLPSVRFTVEALLRMDPSPELVVFDTVLEIARGEFDVRDSDAADAGVS